MTQKQQVRQFESQNVADQECVRGKKVTQKQQKGQFESQNVADRPAKDMI